MSEDTSNSERYLKMSDLRKEAEKRYPLWDFFAEEHDLTLTEGQLDDIIQAVKKHLANDTLDEQASRFSVDALVMPTKNDVPRNYLMEAVKKLTGKYYTPGRILQRIEQEETAKPNFDVVIDE